MTNSQNNIKKVEKENEPIPNKSKNLLNINKLMEYKYIYYINKKNRKLKKFNNEYNSKSSLNISNIIKDLQRIKK